MQRHQRDNTEYVYGMASQKAKVYQAFKSYTYGHITQGAVGLILMEIGAKLQQTATPVQDELPLGMRDD